MGATAAGRSLYLVPPTRKPEQQQLFDAPKPAEPAKPRYQKKTTREIKKELIAQFNHPFSVTAGRGTASHWIRISWIDGPTDEAVHAHSRQYNDNANDDTMTDCWCGSQYTNQSRNISYDAWMYAARIICREYRCEMPETEKKRCYDDSYDYANIKSDPRIEEAGEWFSTLVHRQLCKIDFRTVSVQQEMRGETVELQADDTIATAATPEPEPETVEGPEQIITATADGYDLAVEYRDIYRNMIHDC